VGQAEKGLTRTAPQLPTQPPLPQPPPAAVFDPFFRQIYPELVKLGAWYSRNWQDAEDAAAQTMVKVRQHWWRIGDGKHEAYARTVLLREVVKIRRKRQAHNTFPAPTDELPDQPSDGLDLLAYENNEWIARLLATLGPAQRETVEGFLAGRSYREMALEQRRNEPAVRKNMQLALGKLRSSVEGYEQRSGPSNPRREETR